MSTADILAKLMQKKQERAKLDSQICELEQQFYLSLLHEGTQRALDVEERPDDPHQHHVVGILCDCKEPVKVLENYKGKGVDYYCCARPMSSGCRFWQRADEYQVAGGYK